MKGLMVIAFPVIVAFVFLFPAIRKATFSKIIKEKPTLKEIIQEYAPEISKKVREIRQDTVYLTDGKILIFGKGWYVERVKVARKLLKSGVKAKIIDLSVPGYALIKTGGRR